MRLALLLLLSLAGAPAARAQVFSAAALNAAVAAHMGATGTPGVAVAVVQGDSVVYARGYGVANLETGAPVTPDVLFQIGSVTKTLTAALVVGLAEEGVLRLDTPIGTEMDGLQPEVAALTLDRLLSQTAGLRDVGSNYGPHDEAALALYARTLGAADVMAAPGAFSYSNADYALAGAVAEAAGDTAYAALMAGRLFGPLGMPRSTFRPTTAMTYPLAVGHAGEPGAMQVTRPLADNAAIWPAGYVYSSASELARFARALANGGRVEGTQVLPAGVADALMEPRVALPVFLNGLAYGYGLFVERRDGERLAWHAGTMPGSSALIAVLPDRHAAVVVLANAETRLDAVADAALGLAPRPMPEAAASAPVTGAEAARLAGRYTNRWPFELAVVDGRLVFRRFGEELEVERVGPDLFAAHAPGEPARERFRVLDGSDGRPALLQWALWSFARE